MSTPRSVVILGAGFGGIACARTLMTAARGDIKVTVIDRSPYHVFTPLLYEAATGFIEHEDLGSAKLLGAGVSIATADVLARLNANFIEDEVVGIDWDKREVRRKLGPSVAFDDLVIALGSEINYFGIPGLAEHAFRLKTVTDADRLRERVHEALHTKEKGTRRPLNVVIGGGGATGVELAAELSMFLRRHVLKGHISPKDFHVSIVEATPRLLGAMAPDASVFALERLKSLGVHPYLDTAIKEARPGEVSLVPRACKPGETPDQLLCEFTAEGQKTVTADIVVWCGGVRGSSSLERLGVPLDERGKRVPVNASMEIDGHPNAYAIGDSALAINPATKLPAPWLAQAAISQGETAAQNILARMSGRGPVVHAFPSFPVVVPLGGKFAIGVLGKWNFRGFSGWALHEAATLRYFMTILPFFSAVRLWWKGALMYSWND